MEYNKSQPKNEGYTLQRLSMAITEDAGNFARCFALLPKQISTELNETDRR